ncbi:hypothetical protein LPB19_05010 [Marinobacter salinisoli]|uniref:Uncharacterized protein n=1 Tax=Marinobacter salinisoli TaxID=2769486 RepID=A0ABX7MTR2_9GAMM|nr:DUF6231 family protein [Marinobacter salinisoli]QSP95772.1 hypothetical protein LPB19_05010 [Marinobacter salinisoli]
MTNPNYDSLLQQVLASILDTCQPESLLCCGATADTVGEHWHQHSKNTRMSRIDPKDPNSDLPLNSVHDLALVSDTLEHLPFDEGALFLGQLRNYGTHQIAVLAGESPDWAFKDFLGLGFRRHTELEQRDGTVTLYTYNLDNYNHKRQWNNPKHWANPEMWGKAWW